MTLHAQVVEQRRRARERAARELCRQYLPTVPTPGQLQDQARRLVATTLAEARRAGKPGAR